MHATGGEYGEIRGQRRLGGARLFVCAEPTEQQLNIHCGEAESLEKETSSTYNVLRLVNDT